MQGSLGSIIWTICYLSVLVGLSAYGIHRYLIIYLFLKNRKRQSVPAGRFRAVAEGDRAVADFQRGLRGRALAAFGQRDGLPARTLQIQVLDDSTDETREMTAHLRGGIAQRGVSMWS